MLTPDHPSFTPIVLPNDVAVLKQVPPQEALMLSAVYSANPRMRDLIKHARDCTSTLLIDPKTAHFQFEGYMSMPDYRALPYSPGNQTLGTLCGNQQGLRAPKSAAHLSTQF